MTQSLAARQNRQRSISNSHLVHQQRRLCHKPRQEDPHSSQLQSRRRQSSPPNHQVDVPFRNWILRNCSFHQQAKPFKPTQPYHSHDKLQACSNEEKVNAISCHLTRISILLPSPLARRHSRSGTSNHAKLIPAVNAAAIKIDAEHKNDPSYLTTAAEHAGDFLLWF